MNEAKLRLYGREICHLCDEAEGMLRRLGLVADYVDIAGNAELLKRYGTRIPVLQRMDSGAELGWPFDATAVVRFMGA